MIINHFKAEWDHETVYFFEKFVTSSEICTFDGLIDHDGNIVLPQQLSIMPT